MPQNQAHVHHPHAGSDPTKLFVFIDIDTAADIAQCEGAPKALPNILQLIECAKETGQPVLSTLSGDAKLDGTSLDDAATLSSDSQVPDTLPSQCILTGESSLASHSHFKSVISKVYGRTAIIFGTGLDDALKLTTLKLRSLGLPCRVIGDACLANDESQRDSAIREIIESGAVMVPTNEMIPAIKDQLGLNA